MSLVNRTVDRGCAACDEKRLNHVVLIRAPYEIDGGAYGKQTYGIVELAERLPSEADESAMGTTVAVEVLIIVNFRRCCAVTADGRLMAEVIFDGGIGHKAEAKTHARPYAESCHDIFKRCTSGVNVAAALRLFSKNE